MGYFIYWTKSNQIAKENKLKHEIRELEKAALKAQMNPHFIFNCLNSIQGYIMKNDKEFAMLFLAKFSKLIRKYLNASSVSRISIAQEIEMLKMYIELEQLRFQDAFTCSFTIDRNINQEQTTIPSMLIQPIVENAIIHGMKGKSKREGHISILFNKNEDQLVVEVHDNGPGLKPTKDKEHESVGLSITKKRLALINQSKEYTLRTGSDTEGTVVRIFLPIASLKGYPF
jgi:LytS/YehU family sensor histidine kinase